MCGFRFLAKKHHLLVVLLLIVHASLLGWSGYCHSPVIDEVPHLVAGISYWHLGTYELYNVNPPLVRQIAALPLLFQNPAIRWDKFNYGPGVRSESFVAQDFVAANGIETIWYITVARWACIPLSLLGGYICYRWARELYGEASGLVALALWAFCPTILGWGATITSDVGAAALGVTACYVFWRWLKEPTWTCAFFAGITLGLAEATKTTWFFLFGLWPLIAFFWTFARGDVPIPGRRLQQLTQTMLILVVGLSVLNLVYEFEGSFRKLGEYDFVSQALTGQSEPGLFAEPGNVFADTWLGHVPLPFPEPYVKGIDLQKRDFEVGVVSFLCGQFRQDGWWYYYLYAFVVKTPVGTVLLLILALGVTVAATSYRARSFDELVVLVPPAAVFWLVSSQTGLNRHFRYILPALPFVFIWVSKVALSLSLRHRLLAIVSIGALVWSVTSSLLVYPHEISYFNELAGGPANGHRHLLDSNIDAGQDLLFLKRWVDGNPGAEPLFIDAVCDCYGQHIGLKGVRRHERQLAPGWYAISAQRLYGPGAEYAYFRTRFPIARAGFSIYVFYLSEKEAPIAQECP